MLVWWHPMVSSRCNRLQPINCWRKRRLESSMLPFATSAKQICIRPHSLLATPQRLLHCWLGYPTGNSIDNEANKKRESEIYKYDDKVTWCKCSTGLVGESVEWLRLQESVRKRKVVTRYDRIISLFHSILASLYIDNWTYVSFLLYCSLPFL